MLLAVDIGNTSIKFAVFDGKILKHRSSIPTNANDISAALASVDMPVSTAIICSVVPPKAAVVADIIREKFGVEPQVITHKDDLGLTVQYEPLEAIGTDRLVNAFAAAERYGKPVIVCSLGTATTIDVVNAKRELLGGLIAPGMATTAKALHLSTAQLPEIEVGPADSVINQTTASSIRAGVYYSQVGLIETAVARMRKDVDSDAKVIATGGFARMVAAHCDSIDVVDDDLLLEGLQMLDARLNSR